MNISAPMHCPQSKVLITENQIIYFKSTQIFYEDILPFGKLFLILLAFKFPVLKISPESTLKRLRNRYRLVVMNDDTYEEVVTFKLSRLSVYVMLCTIFVVLVGLTVALIVFTPLRYYIPGSGADYRADRELRQMKLKTDSLEDALKHQEQYRESLQRVLRGDVTTKLDTTQIAVPKEEIIGN